MDDLKYYGSAPGKHEPPPGLTHRAYREGAQAGRYPGHKLPGRGGWIVSTAEWDEWVRSLPGQTPAKVDPIEADIRRRFRCAS